MQYGTGTHVQKKSLLSSDNTTPNIITTLQCARIVVDGRPFGHTEGYVHIKTGPTTSESPQSGQNVRGGEGRLDPAHASESGGHS